MFVCFVLFLTPLPPLTQNEIGNIEKELKALSAFTSLPNAEVISLAQQRFLPFVQQANELLQSLNESFRVMTSLLQDTASIFGESLNVTKFAEDGSDPSQKFFQMVSQITIQYRKADEEMKQWLLDESKNLPTLRSQTSVDSTVDPQEDSSREAYLEDLRKKDTDENLFGRFRNQQEASADDMISQLKAKMKLKKLKADAM